MMLNGKIALLASKQSLQPGFWSADGCVASQSDPTFQYTSRPTRILNMDIFL